MTLEEFNASITAMNSDGSIAVGNGDVLVVNGRYTLEQLERIVSLWKQLRGPIN